MKYFGYPVQLHYITQEDLIETPVGSSCGRCSELIDKGNHGVVMPYIGNPDSPYYYLHLECYLRGVFGSLGHQRRQCSCYGGTLEDPPEMTPREAAIAAVQEYYHANNQTRR